MKSDFTTFTTWVGATQDFAMEPRKSDSRESATCYARDYHPWFSSAFASANRSPSRNAPGLEKKQEITTPASPPLLEKSRGVRCEPGEYILL